MTPQTLRQMLVGLGLTMCCVSDGFIFGQMSGMIDALGSKDSSIPLTEEDISWIASTINVLCIVGYAFMGFVANKLGRRKSITIINLPVIASWIILYFAYNKTILILSRIVLGVCFGGILILVFMSIGEYNPPTIRPLCMNLITCVGSLIGITLGHVLSIVLHWRYVALIGTIPSSLAAILPLFWVESPAWLASKGQFDECEKVFKALHPSNEATDSELRLLLAYEKQKRSDVPKTTSEVLILRKLTIVLRKSYFWNITILSIIICFYRVASGKVLFSTLAITMLQDITHTSEILLFTLAVDGFTMIGAVLSCFILYKFKIRNILFTGGIIANVCLMGFALSLYLYPGNNTYMSWMKVSLLALYFVTVTAGPYPILDLLMTEIFPLEIKSFLMLTVGVISSILTFLSIQFAALMITSIGYHGIFFLNSAIIFLCLVYFWFYLPETKNRSLQEIEYYFKNGTFDYDQQLFNCDHTNELLNKKSYNENLFIS